MLKQRQGNKSRGKIHCLQNSKSPLIKCKTQNCYSAYSKTDIAKRDQFQDLQKIVASVKIAQNYDKVESFQLITGRIYNDLQKLEQINNLHEEIGSIYFLMKNIQRKINCNGIKILPPQALSQKAPENSIKKQNKAQKLISQNKKKQNQKVWKHKNQIINNKNHQLYYGHSPQSSGREKLPNFYH